MTSIKDILLARHAANVARAHPWLPGHSCHTTKGAEMASKAPSSDSQPLTASARPIPPNTLNGLTGAVYMDVIRREADEGIVGRLGGIIRAQVDVIAERDAAIASQDAKIERMTYERSHPFSEAIQATDDRRAL